jgi:hypothetical protein
MKRIGASIVLALLGLVLAGLFPAAAADAPAAPGEHRLTAEEIRDLARRQLLWCDGFHAATDDCQMVTLVGLLPDGRIGQTTTWVVENKPLLQVYIGDVNQFEGDRICSTVDVKTMPIGFTLNGKKVPETLALALKQTLTQLFASLQGKRVCQAFFRGADPNRLREEVTVDGKRRKDLESNYVLRTGAEGFALRSETEDKSAGGNKIKA